MKKKKRTLYIRKIRKRSNNKSIRYSSFNFLNKFNDFFIARLIDNNFFKNTPSIFKFLISFFSMNKKVVLNILKKLGVCLNFKLNGSIVKSSLSYYLKSKFSKKSSIAYAISFKNFVSLKKLFFLKLKKTSFNSRLLRSSNVENKKRMTLYFSYRHLLSLPVRGQRTKTNAKIRKNYSII